MNNRLSVGLQFLLDNSYYRFSVPPKMIDTEPRSQSVNFKQALGRVPLPTTLVSALGSVERLEEQGTSELPFDVRLAALLHLSFGLLRYEPEGFYPIHRGVPSPRCYYPTELYVLLPDGVYRYLPLLHQLERLRDGWEQKRIERAVGRTLRESDTVIVIVSNIAGLAESYLNFSYNLCGLEAGHTTGHLSLLSRRLGWIPQVCERFLDGEVIDELGLEEAGELPLTVLVLQEQDDAPAMPAPEGAPFVPDAEPLDEQPGWLDMMRASRLHDSADLPERAAAPVLHRQAAEEMIPYRQTTAPWQHQDLVAAIKTRTSGNQLRGLTMAEELQWEDLSDILRLYADDSRPEWQQVRQTVGLYAAVNRVTGLQKGFYQFEQDGLALLEAGDAGAKTQDASVYSAFDLNPLPLSLFLTVDFEYMLSKHGNRGYVIGLQHAGRAAQYLELLAAAKGWYMRPVRNYLEAKVEDMFGLLSGNTSVVYQLLTGKDSRPWLALDLGL